MFIVLLLVCVLEAAALTVLSEGFEDEIFPPPGWEVHRGANGLGTAHDWMRSTTTPFAGEGGAFVRYEDSAGYSEDWLVTPRLAPTADINMLEWQQKSTFKDNYASSFLVGVSTSRLFDPTNFTFLVNWTEADTAIIPYLDYHKVSLDLSAYVGSEIRVAFMLFNDNGDNWLIDDVGGIPLVEVPNVLVLSLSTAGSSIWEDRLGALANIVRVAASNVVDCASLVWTATVGAESFSVTSSFSAVFIDPGVTAGPATANLQMCAIPVVVAEPDLYSHFLIAAGGARASAGDKSLVMTGDAHPLKAGLSGSVSVTASACGYGLSTAGSVVATVTPGSDTALFVVGVGELLVDGSSSPHVRVGFPLDSLASSNERELIDAAILFTLSSVTCVDVCNSSTEVCVGGRCRCQPGYDRRLHGDGICHPHACADVEAYDASGLDLGATWGSTVAYGASTVVCPAGLSGSIKRQCSSSAEWTAVTDVCVGCRSEAAVDAAGLHLITAWPHSLPGENRSALCPTGFSGEVNISCGGDEQWGTPVGTCTRVAACSAVASCGPVSNCSWCDRAAICQELGQPCANCSVLSPDACELTPACELCVSTQECHGAAQQWVPEPVCPDCTLYGANESQCLDHPGCLMCAGVACVHVDGTCAPFCYPTMLAGATGSFTDGSSSLVSYTPGTVKKWQITVPTGRVHLTPVRFATAPQDEIRVKDGAWREDGDVLAVFTGDSGVFDVATGGSVMTVELHAGPSAEHGTLGFEFAWASTPVALEPCDVLTDVQLSVGSPSFSFESHSGPGQYPPSLSCTWRINASEGHNVVMEVNRFHLYPEDEDFLRVTAPGGPVGLDGAHAEYRASSAPNPIGGLPELVVLFQSSASLGGSGFSLRAYQLPSCPSGCSGNGDCPATGICVCDAGWSGAACNHRGCGETRAESAMSGRITSVSLNDEALSWTSCSWSIAKPSGETHVVLIITRRLSSGLDEVVVTSGMNGLGPVVASWSGAGYAVPSVLSVPSDGFHVAYRARGGETRAGFEMSYDWRAAHACPEEGCGAGLCVADGVCACDPLHYGTNCSDGRHNQEWASIAGFDDSGNPAAARTGGCMVATSSTDALLFGGSVASTPLLPDDVVHFNVTSGRWRSRAVTGPAPPGRMYPACTAVPEGLLMHGGQLQGGTPTADLWLFATATNTWTELASPGVVRRHHDACLLDDGTAVIVHGEDATGPVASIVAVTLTDTGATTTVIHGGTSPRSGHAVVCSGHKVFVHGGIDEYGVPVASFEVYDFLADDGWQTVAPSITYPLPRSYFQASARYGSQMVIFGGVRGADGGLHSSDVFVFDSTSKSLFHPSSVVAKLEPRSHFTACQVGGAFIVQGGYNVAGEQLSDFWAWISRPSVASNTIATSVPDNVTAGVPFSFHVVAFDSVNDPTRLGGDVVTVSAEPLRGLSGSAVGLVQDLQTGEYKVDMVFNVATVMEVTVQLQPATLGSVPNDISGSPLEILVLPAPTDVASSAVTLPASGMLSIIMDEPHELIVHSRDRLGNRRYVGGDTFSIALLESEHRRAIPTFSGSLRDNGDGSYVLSFAVDRPGSFYLDVTGSGGTSVQGSPFPITVEQAPAEQPEYSRLYTALALIAAGVVVCALLISALAYLKYRHDHPAWRINFNELELEEIIGRGASAEVYRGTYRGMAVAVKKLINRDKVAEWAGQNEDDTDRNQNHSLKLSALSMDMATNTGTHFTTMNTQYNTTAGKITKRTFMEEVSMLSTLRHPNVVLVVGACLEKRNRCIVMQHMPQGSLFDVLHNPSLNLGWKRRLEMARYAAMGVDFLHQREPPLVHKDIKSLNFLVDESFVVKVSDFGVENKRHKVLGTMKWMAPELLERTADPSISSDSYSFGVVLWEVASREEPYYGMDRQELPEKIIGGLRPRIVKEWPRDLSTLMEECMKAEADARPPFREIVSRIKRVEAELPPDKETASDSLLLRKVYSQEEIDNAKGGMFVAPREFDNVTFLFCHVVDFHEIEEELSSQEVNNLLRRLHQLYDELCKQWDIDLVETIGDMLLAVGGLDKRSEDDREIAVRVANTALGLLNAEVLIRQDDPERRVTMRVGMHAGPVVASVSGTTNRKLTFVGDTVNTTSRMESHGEPGKAQLSPVANRLLADTSVQTVSRGLRDIKGKGKMETFLLKNPVKDLGRDIGSYGLPHVFASISSNSICEFCGCSIGHFKRGMRCLHCCATAHHHCRKRLLYSCPARHVVGGMAATPNLTSLVDQ